MSVVTISILVYLYIFVLRLVVILYFLSVDCSWSKIKVLIDNPVSGSMLWAVKQ